MANPFSSKKFVYAIVGVVMFFVTAYLPVVLAELGLALPGDTMQQVNSMLPWVLVLFFALIGGHSLQDAISLYTGYQPNAKLRDLIEDVIDELLGDDDEAPAVESVPLAERPC